MNRSTPTTFAAVQTYHADTAATMLAQAKYLSPSTAPEALVWAFEWLIGAPRYNATDAMHAAARGRVYSPQPSERDLRVSVVVRAPSTLHRNGLTLSTRPLSRVPADVLRAAQPFLR